MSYLKPILLTITGLLLFSTKGYCENWIYFSSDYEDSLWYYDSQSITHRDETTQVVTKIVMSDKEQKKYQERYPSIPGIKKIRYILETVEINCAKNCARIVSRVWYDSSDKEINRQDYLNAQFSEIIPGTPGEPFSEIMCGKSE